MNVIVKVIIACILRWRVVFVGITLLAWLTLYGITFHMREMSPRASGAAIMKKVGLWLYNHFCKIFEVNSF